eukprot:4302552-Ditylum_brightwellii.AAC.1
MPFVSQKDQAIQAVKDLTVVLNNKQTSAIFETSGDEQLKALKKLATLFGTMVTTDASQRVPNKETIHQNRDALPRVKAHEIIESRDTAKEEPTTVSTPNVIPMIQYKKELIKLPPP